LSSRGWEGGLGNKPNKIQDTKKDGQGGHHEEGTSHC